MEDDVAKFSTESGNMCVIAPLPPPLGRIRSVRQPEFSVTSPIMPATLSSAAPSFV